MAARRIVIAMMVALALLPLPSRAGLPISLVLALLAHQVYVQQAIITIQKAGLPGGGLDESVPASQVWSCGTGRRSSSSSPLPG